MKLVGAIVPEESWFRAAAGDILVASGALAAARGALEAGVGLVTTYPGSPITETFEALAGPQYDGRPECDQSVNEHVGFHRAMGYALTGGRAMITMKHVGFNVAADPAHYIGYTGVRGGMVILVGTDPGATCSTGEYDVRFYAFHTHLPLLEPTGVQDTLDLTRAAFQWSEEDELPYVIAIPAGTCYAMEGIVAGRIESLKKGGRFVHSPDFTNVGRRAVTNHFRLLERLTALQKRSRRRSVVRFHPGTDGTLIITSGVNYHRVRESLHCLGLSSRVGVFASALTHPFPTSALKKALTGINRIVFVEDLGGFLETSLSPFLLRQSSPPKVFGKDLFPAAGGLDFSMIQQILSDLLVKKPRKRVPSVGAPDLPYSLPEREGTFCPGCSYRGFFHVLMEEIGPDAVVGGDIGCSSLPPHFSSWLTCMNSGPAIAAGVAAGVRGRQKVVSLIGDSTFWHSGFQTVLDLHRTNSDQLCFILDNFWTAMTGHQATISTPVSPTGIRVPHVDIETVLRGIGIAAIPVVDPYQLKVFRGVVRSLLRESGFRVVLVRRECRLQSRRRSSGAGNPPRMVFLCADRCQECGVCYERFCCPAIIKDALGSLMIDQTICTQCGVCAQICPNGAIVSVTRVGREGE
jgi:indolepyruvate ferredoxin oxidoreductase alpha subunit